MRKTVTYLLGAACCLLVLAVSCRHISPEEPEEMVGETIRIDASLGGTKAMLNSSSDLNTNGSQVQVYDIVQGFTGEMGGVTYNNADLTSIDDNVTYGNSTWDFVGLPYPWTRTGVHNFFGWLSYDAKSNMYSSAEVSPSYNASTHVLTVPSKTFTVDSHQFDFLYSRNIEVRDAASRNYAQVPLNLAHLFSAFALTVENRSNEPVTIQSISMPNLPVMNGSATIDYTTDGRTAPVVTYTAPTAGATQFFDNPITSASGIQLASKSDPNNNKINAFTGARFLPSDAYDYRILWPLGTDVLSPTTPNPNQGVAGHPYTSSVNDPADSLIRISYTFTVRPNVGTPDEITRTNVGVKIPNDVSFDPGKKTYINITINDKIVDLTFLVQEWDVREYPLEFSSGSVTVTSSFQFVPGTYAERVGDDYYIDISQPLVGRFSITNPVGARIQVAPEGDAQYFNVSLNHDIVDPKTDVGEILVTITPNTSFGTPTSAKKLRLSFYVVNGTQEININSEVRYEGNIVWSN